MAQKIGVQWDLDKIPVLGLAFEPSDTPPVDPVDGQPWHDTTTGRLKVHLDGAWRTLPYSTEVSAPDHTHALPSHNHDISEIENLAAGVLEPLQQEVSAHSADTTDVHGIANTALLETTSGAQSKANAAVATHSADTTAVHGIADTSLLETIAGAQAKVDAAIAAITDGAPTALDTLVEIADRLADDQTALASVLLALDGKADSTDLSTVATSGAYADLSGKPTLATVAGTGAYADLLGRPTLATVAGTGAYSDLLGKPSLAVVATSGLYSDLSGRPSLATVATSGSYADLTGKPTLAGVATSGAYADLTGKPALATVATSGVYSDLTGRPTIVPATKFLMVDTPAGTASGTLPVSMTAVPSMSLVITEGDWLVSGYIMANGATARARLVNVGSGVEFHPVGGFVKQGDVSLWLHDFWPTRLTVGAGSSVTIGAEWQAKDTTAGITTLRKCLMATPI